MKVVVLAGGRGTRLGLEGKPKPMVEVCGRPLLELQVEMAARSGFREFVFLTGYMSEVIEEHFGDGSSFGVHIEYVREDRPLGTAGAVAAAKACLEQPFIVLYGDILMDVDLARMADFHHGHDATVTLFVHPNDHPFDSDVVLADRDGRIHGFRSKPHEPGIDMPNLVSAAIYVLDPAVLDRVDPSAAHDWGRDVFPALLASGVPMRGYRSVEYAKDIGTVERLRAGERDLESGRVARLRSDIRKPVTFLDRDGVINAEVDGVLHPGDLQLLDGVGEAVRMLNEAGVPAICVTNQPAVAKGFMSLDMLEAVFARLDTLLAEHGAYLDDVFFCPHHPERGFPDELLELKVLCSCRKPSPGMLQKAALVHGVDLQSSWLVGDRGVDVRAAHAVGANAVLLADANAADGVVDASTPELVVPSLFDAVNHILGVIR